MVPQIIKVKLQQYFFTEVEGLTKTPAGSIMVPQIIKVKLQQHFFTEVEGLTKTPAILLHILEQEFICREVFITKIVFNLEIHVSDHIGTNEQFSNVMKNSPLRPEQSETPTTYNIIQVKRK
jgi:hypothetical protein